MATQTIRLKKQEEADLLSPLDPDQTVLSEDVASYLVQCLSAKHTRSKDNCVIQLHCEAPINLENVQRCMREHFSREKNAVKHSLRHLSYKAICLALFGAVVLGIMFYLSIRSDSMFLEILDIISWVAVWEATSIIIMQTYDPRQAQKNT